MGSIIPLLIIKELYFTFHPINGFSPITGSGGRTGILHSEKWGSGFLRTYWNYRSLTYRATVSGPVEPLTVILRARSSKTRDVLTGTYLRYQGVRHFLVPCVSTRRTVTGNGILFLKPGFRIPVTFGYSIPKRIRGSERNGEGSLEFGFGASLPFWKFGAPLLTQVPILKFQTWDFFSSLHHLGELWWLSPNSHLFISSTSYFLLLLP